MNETSPALPQAVVAVSDFNRLARQAIERALPLMWVSGEVSNLTRAASGHLYFTLKDDEAQLRCVMFRSRAMLLPFRLAQGERVEVRGLGTLYETRGEFQLVAEAIRRSGVGALYEAYARLKAKLDAEGLFDAAAKRALPRLPGRIGVVSSLHAAALHDVLAALKRRCPHVPVLVCPAPVQGAEAAPALVQAMRSVSARGECDVLILARGGGSIEDLWAFNDEALVRAVAACPLPVICGVGHETDVTLADLAADQRAATPTAAAELASAGWVEARARLGRLAVRLQDASRRRVEISMQRVDQAARRLVAPGERLARLRLHVLHLASRLGACRRHEQSARRHALAQLAWRLSDAQPQPSRLRVQLQACEKRLSSIAARGIEQRRTRLANLATHLFHLDPAAPLARGYALVRDARGEVIRDAARLSAGDELDVRFARGWARSTVIERGD